MEERILKWVLLSMVISMAAVVVVGAGALIYEIVASVIN